MQDSVVPNRTNPLHFMTRFVLTVASAALVWTAQPTAAADLPPLEEAPILEDRPWKFEVDPFYGWIVGMNGTVGLFGQEVKIDFTPIDILSNLDDFFDAADGLYYGAGELRYRRFGVQYDIVYISVGGTREFGGNLIGGAIDLSFSLTMGTLAGSYRIQESPTSYVDVFAGARVTHVKSQLDLMLGPGGLTGEDGDTWWDAVVGIKGRKDLTDNWYLIGSALVGGGSSDYILDAYGYLGYEWANGVSVYGGFRAADTKYQKGSFKWDVLVYGPVAGFKIRF